MSTNGRIVLLNGAPRSGKTTLARALQSAAREPWLIFGNDLVIKAMTPKRFQPGLGLRPGQERPDLEPFVARCIDGLFASLAGFSHSGLNVVADIGGHDDYATLTAPWQAAVESIGHLPRLIVGVRCGLEQILERRATSDAAYLCRRADGSIPDPVLKWQTSVHLGWTYDLEVDTSVEPAEVAVQHILQHLWQGEDHGSKP